MSKKILNPSFFILGVQKGGTSSLHKYLTESNELFFPQKKELHFFDAYLKKGMSWYLDHFKVEEDSTYKFSGEATPYYIFHPDVPKRLYSEFPNAKLIILFRNPIDRAFSHYQMSVRRGLEQRSFSDAIKEESIFILKQKLRMLFNKKFNVFHAEFSYKSRGMYFKQVKRWLKIFPHDNFLFLKSEDLFLNPQQEIEKVCDFLEISKFEITEFEVINPGCYQEMLDENTKRNLEKMFASDIKCLENLIGKKFNWY